MAFSGRSRALQHGWAAQRQPDQVDPRLFEPVVTSVFQPVTSDMH